MKTGLEGKTYDELVTLKNMGHSMARMCLARGYGPLGVSQERMMSWLYAGDALSHAAEAERIRRQVNILCGQEAKR